MVGIVAVHYAYVQGKPGMQRQGPEKFLGKGGVEGPDLLVLDRCIKVQVGPVGDIDGNLCQGFVHGDNAETVTADAPHVAEGFFECLPEADAEVLNGMMVIHLDISSPFDIEIEKTVHPEKCQHVVHEGNTAADGGGPQTVKFEADPDIRFPGAAVYFPTSRCIAHESFPDYQIV